MEFLRHLLQDPLYATVASTLFGGLITWVAAWWYYKKAGDELLKETALLRKANMAVVYMLEHPEAEMEVQRDSAGNPVGLVVSARGSTGTRFNLRGSASSVSRDP